MIAPISPEPSERVIRFEEYSNLYDQVLEFIRTTEYTEEIGSLSRVLFALQECKDLYNDSL